jgi:aryl-alcohol dehydrogenase-like predicted oxidoreductase
MGASRLGLGTVQFGTAYGITNAKGQVDPATVAAILEAGRRAGIHLIDTAAAYGMSEEVIGPLVGRSSDYVVVTKTLPKPTSIQAAVERARQSHRTLGGKQLHGLLVHHVSDLQTADGPEFWKALLELRDAGLFAGIGISAYITDDLLMLARRFRPAIMQLPVSILDQRLIRQGTLAALKDLGVEIHVRSAFLQGLVFLDPMKLPKRLAHAQAQLLVFHARLRDLRMSPLEAAIRFLLSVREVDNVVVGTTSVDEIHEIIHAARLGPADASWHRFAIDDGVLLDPRQWNSP